MAIELAKNKQESLEKYTSGKTIKELKGDVERKRSDELAKKATWELEIEQGEKLERQIYACDIKAPADGTVVYANDPSRAFDGQPPDRGRRDGPRAAENLQRARHHPACRSTPRCTSRRSTSSPRNMKAKIRVDALPDET